MDQRALQFVTIGHCIKGKLARFLLKGDNVAKDSKFDFTRIVFYFASLANNKIISLRNHLIRGDKQVQQIKYPVLLTTQLLRHGLTIDSLVTFQKDKIV